MNDTLADLQRELNWIGQEIQVLGKSGEVYSLDVEEVGLSSALAEFKAKWEQEKAKATEAHSKLREMKNLFKGLVEEFRKNIEGF